MRDRVVIVGAGVGGLTAAALLATRGLDVTVVEAESIAGGKLRAIDGIDAGPTVFTKRAVFDDLFEACGARLDDHLTITPADILARHAWSDGASLDLFADAGASEAAIGAFAGPAALQGYRRFRDEAKRIHDAIDVPFMQQSRTNPFGLGWRMGLRGLRDFGSLRPFQSLWSALGEFMPDPRLRQLFGRYATYCGSSPFDAPATLMLVAHVEATGVWTIDGGMHRLAGALAALATRQGALVRYATRVAAVLVEHDRAAGVVLVSGEVIRADRVIMNADPAALGAGVFGAQVARAAAAIPPRSRSLSALVWSGRATTQGMPLSHHNVFFSDDYRAEFDAIARGDVPVSPTVYVCAQSYDGVEIIVNAPANGDRHHYTSQETDRCRSQILATLARCGVTLTAPSLTVQTPNDFERLNRSTGGALYGRVSHGWAASFRRQGARTRMPGLYCAGGSTHPGAGVPMAATSGRLAAECLLLDRGSTVRSRPMATAGGTSMPSPTTVPTA